MNLQRSNHYNHVVMVDENGIYSPSPILVVGTSGKGKSLFVERMLEIVEDNVKDMILFILVDVSHTLEGAFPMFHATDKIQLEKLAFQKEEPRARDNVKLWIINGTKIGEWHKRCRGLPEGEIITFSAKKIFGDKECLFLLETITENSVARLLMQSASELKSNEGIDFVKYYANHLIGKGYRKKFDDTIIGDKNDYNMINSVLKPLIDSGAIMPDNFKYNFDIKNLISDKGKRHVFVYNGLPKEYEKLQDFFLFHILNEIARHSDECKYPLSILIEEAQSKVPFKGEGHKKVLAEKMGDVIGTIRKTAKGTGVFITSRSWNKMASQVRDECGEQIIFGLSQQDMSQYLKVNPMRNALKINMNRLLKGEFVRKGKESKTLITKVPRHGHKHITHDFMELYKKFYPQKITNYSAVFKEIESAQAESRKQYHDLISMENKKIILEEKKILAQKNRSRKAIEQRNALEEELRNKKAEEKKGRDEEIFKVRDELVTAGKKASYRNIADEVNKRGFKVSYVTVKNVLEGNTNEQETSDLSSQDKRLNGQLADSENGQLNDLPQEEQEMQQEPTPDVVEEVLGDNKKFLDEVPEESLESNQEDTDQLQDSEGLPKIRKKANTIDLTKEGK